MTTVSNGQTFNVSSGQTVSGLAVEGGTVNVYAGGAVVSTTISGGEVLLSGGTASGTLVEANGEQAVVSGGAAVSATILDDGNQTIDAGGAASGTFLSGGVEYVEAGAADSGATVGYDFGFAEQHVFGVATSATLVDGEQYVESGGTASGTLAGSDSVQNILAGGSAIGATVDGYQYVYGTATGTTVDSGGYEYVESGGTAAGTVISGGTLEFYPGGSLGSAAVGFEGVGGALVIFSSAPPANVISGFAPGDTIDLANANFTSGGVVVLTAGNVLPVVENGNSYDLAFDPSQDFAGDAFFLEPDTAGGTLVEVAGTAANLAGQDTLTSATEGTALPATTTVATFTDPNASDTGGDFTAGIAWGDGTTTSGTVSGGNGSFTIAGGHTYADEGSDPLAVIIVDTLNNSTIAPSATVTVGEGDTLIANPVTFAANPGQAFSGIVASFSDSTYPDNVVSDFTATINWGDGTTTAGTVGGGSGGPFIVTGTHAYVTLGTDTVAVTLSDDPPGTATATADSTAEVTAQLAGQFTLTSATEGTALPSAATVATFTDVNTGDTAGDFTATVNWGDGTTTGGTVSGGNGSFTVAGGHTYAGEGSDPLAVTITDTLSSSTITPSGTVTVGEGDTLVANPTTFSARATIPFSGPVARFTDTTYPGNVVSDFTATINWGDGITTAGTVSGGSGSPFTVSGGHTYAAGGFDPVTVTLSDDSPATATATAHNTALVGVTVVSPNPAPPGGTTADMILSESAIANYEIYDLGNNLILGAGPLGQVGPDWAFAGLGDFNGADTTDMLLRSSTTGTFEVYDISNNNINAAAALGQVGLEWQVAGFGDFNGPGAGTDMIMRDVNTGVFEIYDIANNTVTSAHAFGQVGLEWQVAGFGDFSSNPNETDMLLRNVNTGAFEVYDISNSQLTSASNLGQVGVEWQVAGFGDFSGNANETDMLLRNVNTGVFELYDIQNNQVTTASPIGQVGLEWQVAGFGPLNGTGSSDMVLRNTQTGAFEVYDLAKNQLTGAASLGEVGLEWSVGGFAPDPLTILAR